MSRLSTKNYNPRATESLPFYVRDVWKLCHFLSTDQMMWLSKITWAKYWPPMGRYKSHHLIFFIFRFCFPFGRPEGALKSTLSLLERVGCANVVFLLNIHIFQVLMKDISTPVPPHEVRAVIKKSLENAALVNYERLSEEARIEGTQCTSYKNSSLTQLRI